MHFPHRLQDKNNMAFMSGVGVSRWLAMRLEGTVLLLLTGVILLVVFTKDAGRLFTSRFMGGVQRTDSDIINC